MKDSILFIKSKAFALRVVRLYKYLREHKESVIAKQMLRAGTSIGANIAESRYAQSKADFADDRRSASDFPGAPGGVERTREVVPDAEERARDGGQRIGREM